MRSDTSLALVLSLASVAGFASAVGAGTAATVGLLSSLAPPVAGWAALRFSGARGLLPFSLSSPEK